MLKSCLRFWIGYLKFDKIISSHHLLWSKPFFNTSYCMFTCVALLKDESLPMSPTVPLAKIPVTVKQKHSQSMIEPPTKLNRGCFFKVISRFCFLTQPLQNGLKSSIWYYLTIEHIYCVPQPACSKLQPCYLNRNASLSSKIFERDALAKTVHWWQAFLKDYAVFFHSFL